MKDPHTVPITQIKEFKINHALLKSRIDELESITATQCLDGNWNYDPYSHGLADGMILALATLKSEEPQFLEDPGIWLCNNIGALTGE